MELASATDKFKRDLLKLKREGLNTTSLEDEKAAKRKNSQERAPRRAKSAMQ